MKKHKTGIVRGLLTAFFACVFAGVGLLVPTQTASATGGELVVSDVFTDGADFTELNLAEYSGVTKDQHNGNADFGLIPAKTWGTHVETGDGYVTYEISADAGYALATLSLDLTASIAHCSLGEYINADRTNIIVSVSGDNEKFKEVFNYYNEYGIEQEHEKKLIELDLSSHVSSYATAYVKISLLHLTYDELEEIVIANGKHESVKAYLGSDADEENKKLALNRTGSRVYGVSFTATQQEIAGVTVSDTFIDGTKLVNLNAFETFNVAKDEYSGNKDHGLVPSSTGWDGFVTATKGYVTYKLSATAGYSLDNLRLTSNLAFGHGGIADFYSNADVKVAVSYDNVNYTDVYSLRADTEIIPIGSDTPKGEGNPSEAIQKYLLELDLSGKVKATQTAYIRIVLDLPERERTPLGQLAACLYDARITANQTQLPSFSLENVWTGGGAVATYAGLVDYAGVAKDANAGNKTFGLIPAEAWGGTVNAGSGYLTYELRSDDGLVFSDLTLKLNLIYANTLSDFANGLANFTVSVSYDKKSFAEVYNLYKEEGYTATSQKAKEVFVNLTAHAKGRGVMFVRIDMICPTTSGIALQKLPTCLLGVLFDGTQASLSENFVALENDWRTGGEVGSFAGVFASENVAKETSKGNLSYALIPASGWGDPVNAGSGYVIYRIYAGDDKALKNLRLTLDYTLKEGGDLVVYTSADSLEYTEFLRASAFKKSPYQNPLKSEEGSYQTLSVDLYSAARNLKEVYVKIEMAHPEGQYNLGKLLTRLYGVSFVGECMKTDDYCFESFEDGADGVFTAETEGNAFETLVLSMQGDLSGATVSVSEDGVSYQKVGEATGGYYQADLTGYAYGIGKLFVKIEGGSISLIRLYGAKFPLTAGVISYELNGGSYADGESNPTSFEVGDPTILLKTPTRAFMEFKGWYTSPDFKGEPVTELDCSALRAYRLYAKWETAVYEVSLTVEGQGAVTVNPVGATEVVAGGSLELTLTPSDGYILVGLSVNGVDVFLTNGNSYKITGANCDYILVATFAERATIHGNFSMDYTANPKYGNAWKANLYDYQNLYITDDERHALGINGGEGYIVYRFEAEDGKYFESAILITVAKLFDHYCLGTREKVDYYIGYDENYENYELVYKSLITRVGDNIATVKQNLTGYVIGKQAFFLKIDIGSNSTNWTLFQNLDIEFTYQTVELVLDYGDYTETTYSQLRGKPLDTSLIKVKEGYTLLSDDLYTDKACTAVYDKTALIDGDLTLYVKCEKTVERYAIAYVLNGGELGENSPESYTSLEGASLVDPTREGYLFSGWYVDEACTLLMTAIPTGRTGDLTLYAKWTEDKPLDFEPDKPIEPDEPDEPVKPTPEKKKDDGCGGSIGFGATLAVAVTAIAVLKKKKGE